ncbi:hypothetical protein [Halorussus lipolyticus]|uniref:hypothetical protein n=1 Tax=Halorussus lipolyticus TaxID=3034024 RepID=UPI0023E7EA9C|nr:hypothetical protein [Halorussus sp. DT80]
MGDTELVERLGEMELNDRVSVTLSDGASFEGPASPIDYVPEDSLRLEIRPEDGATERYELSAEYGDEWRDVAVRHTDASDEGSGWEQLGEVESVEIGDSEEAWHWGPK